MAIFEMSGRRRGQSGQLSSAPFRRDKKIARELFTLAVLLVCFAVNVGFVVQRDHRKVDAAGSNPATVAHRTTAPSPRAKAVEASSSRVSLADVNAAAIGSAAGDLVNTATDGINTA